MAISTAAQTALDRLTQSWGQPLSVTSGFRDPAYNASVGGARNSQHTHGNAFDISVAGMSPEQRLALATAARNAGFQGFGFYDDSLHFDVGAPRAWGPSYSRDSLPGWAADWVGQNVGGGTGGGNITMSTSGGGAMGLLDMQDEPQTFGQRLKAGLKDGRALDAIALAANSLRMNPDQGIAQMIGARQQQRQDAQVANRTAQWLASKGRTDLAEALMTGALDAKAAVGLAMQKPDAVNGVEVGGKLVDPRTGKVIYDPTNGAAPLLTSDQLSGLTALQDDATKATKELALMQDAYTNIETFYTNPGSVSDKSLVVAYAKILDPTSVVHEGESAAIANAGSLSAGMRSTLINTLQGGGNLPPEVRNEIARLAQQMVVTKLPAAQQAVEGLKRTAQAAGLPTDLVFFGNLSAPALPPMNNPPPRPGGGTVQPPTSFVPAP
jgi:hypothetical protein